MNLTRSETHYMPNKVLDLALSLGVHVECLEADWEGACTKCASLFHTAFDSFYGAASNSDEALMMILNDIMEDRNNEIQ